MDDPGFRGQGPDGRLDDRRWPEIVPLVNEEWFDDAADEADASGIVVFDWEDCYRVYEQAFDDAVDAVIDGR